VLVVGFLVARVAFRDRPITHFLLQLAAFASFTSMLALARVSPLAPTPLMGVTLGYAIVSSFKIVWWFGAAWLLSGFIRAVLVFKRQEKETRFLQDLCAGAVYIGAIVGITADVFDIPVSGVLAASGVLAIVLGLALQSTLGDVFSGIVLNLAKPYRPGDWVIIDGGLEGRIVETNWRGTQILTRSNDIATVPNSIISKSRLVNVSEPSEAHGVSISIRLDPVTAPLNGVAVLETALLSCNLMLRAPRAIVTVKSLDALALECELFFFVSPVERYPEVQNEVFDRVYRHCASAGIRLAPPNESSVLLPLLPPPHDADGAPARLLDRLPIFAPLSDDERRLLAPKMKQDTHKAGDIIVEQGVVAGALFVLGAGVLAGIRKAGICDEEVLRYAPGDCFGQASVLTGAVTSFRVQALTAAVVYEIIKSDIAPILKARPAIAAELAQIMARREAAWKDRLRRLDPPKRHPENLAARLALRIRALFGLPE
jgi:small-conductance mechanosensitive channel/CRP-like cAMP-binding protein